jgi:hypothetical protein
MKLRNPASLRRRSNIGVRELRWIDFLMLRQRSVVHIGRRRESKTRDQGIAIFCSTIKSGNKGQYKKRNPAYTT